MTAAIKEEARRRLAEAGAAQLSLRAVARELGMASSALYRYFPSRDDLLTALIIDAYDALGAAAEDAHAEVRSGAPHVRWLAICRAVRRWALDHPHEYALIYGSPVPGYAAPQATIGPASRVARTLLTVVEDAYATGASDGRGVLRPGSAPLHEVVREDAERLGDLVDVSLPAPLVTEFVAAWAQLFGLVGFELFGQFHRVVEARAEFFDRAALRLADGLGLTGE